MRSFNLASFLGLTVAAIQLTEPAARRTQTRSLPNELTSSTPCNPPPFTSLPLKDATSPRRSAPRDATDTFMLQETDYEGSEDQELRARTLLAKGPSTEISVIQREPVGRWPSSNPYGNTQSGTKKTDTASSSSGKDSTTYASYKQLASDVQVDSDLASKSQNLRPRDNPNFIDKEIIPSLFCSGDDLSKKDYAGVCMDGNFLWYSGNDCHNKCKCDEKGVITCDIPSDCGPEKDVVKYCSKGPTFTCTCLLDPGKVDLFERQVWVTTKKPIKTTKTIHAHISFPLTSKMVRDLDRDSKAEQDLMSSVTGAV